MQKPLWPSARPGELIKRKHWIDRRKSTGGISKTRVHGICLRKISVPGRKRPGYAYIAATRNLNLEPSPTPSRRELVPGLPPEGMQGLSPSCALDTPVTVPLWTFKVVINALSHTLAHQHTPWHAVTKILAHTQVRVRERLGEKERERDFIRNNVRESADTVKDPSVPRSHDSVMSAAAGI